MLAFAPSGMGQGGSVSAGQSPRALDASQVGGRVTLGPEWLFHAGDDLAWAQPGLDDSGWRTVSAEKPLTEYGIHDIRYGWYRMHLRVRPDARDLSVAVLRVEGSYEVYANGVRIGGSGAFPGAMFLEQARLRDFSIPAGVVGRGGELVLALRFHINPAGAQGAGTATGIGAEAGLYLYGGEGAAPDAAARDATYVLSHLDWDLLSLIALCLLTGLIALSLFASLREQKEYLGAAVYVLSLARVGA